LSTIKRHKEIKFKKNLGEVLLPVSIKATRERLRPPYTLNFYHHLFSELYLRLSALSVRYS